MTELTEPEKALIQRHKPGGPSSAWAMAPLYAAIEEIIDARLTPIRALADKWHGSGSCSPSWCYACRLRAALDAPVSASQDHDGAEGQGEGDLCAAECGKRVDRTIPNPIPEGFELMWSESMTGRALYCQACFDKPDPEES